jgi:hypothetical protein
VPSWRSPLYTIGGSMVLAWTAAIFAAVGCIFPVVVSILAVRSDERLGQRWQALSAT